jgi:hypothetical protein
MDRQQAKHILKNTGYIGNEVGVAFDVAIKSIEKLEQIERIVKDWNNDASNSFGDMCKINGILKE